MTILGEYSYANYSVVNTIDTHDSGIESTHLHEMIHLTLTKTTEYGFFVTIINRVVKFDPAYEYLNKILIKHMLKLQEGISTFCEVIYHAEKTSFEDTLISLKRLKTSNKKYYNYIYPHLSGLLNFINKNNKCKIYLSPLDLFDIVYKLAFVAMNCSLTSIPIETMLSKKRFKTHIEQRNPALYIPNRRFNILVKELRKVLSSICEEVYDKNIIIYDTLKVIDNSDFYIEIFFNAEKKEQYAQLYVDTTKKYIQDLFSKSNQRDIIFETINMFNTKYVDIQRLHQHVVPSSFRAMYKTHKIDENDILKCAENNDLGIFFILMDNTYKQTINTSSMYVHESVFEMMNSLYQDSIQLMYMSLSQKKSFVSMYPIEKLNLIFSQDKAPIIINYKLTEFIDHLPPDSIKKTFVYCDRPYISAIETINDYATTTKRAKVLAYNDLYIVVIRISDKVDFFLPILSNLLPDVVNDINSNVLNLLLDEDLEINFQEYNLIVNTLFNL